MAKLLFRLNDVPEDEINAVRSLLEQQDFDTYETDSGRWGISVAAIWLRNEDQYEEAHAIIEEYQQERLADARQNDVHQTLAERCAERPIEVIVIAAAIAGVLALSVWPFLTAFSDG